MNEFNTDFLVPYKRVVDTFIEKLGKPTTLYYPGKMQDCANCIYDPIGKKSSNRYKSGGPVHFQVGTCPICNGAGKREVQTTEDIKVRFYADPREWRDLGVEVRSPDGKGLICSYTYNLPKAKKCEYMIIHGLEINVDAYVEYRYKLMGEPIPRGFDHGRYFWSLVERC